MRTGRCLGMKLNGPHVLTAMTDPCNRSVIQMPVSHLQIIRQSLFLHGVSVILRSNENTSAPKVLNGLIGSTMTKFQLEGAGSESQRENLVAKTNTENRSYLC